MNDWHELNRIIQRSEVALTTVEQIVEIRNALRQVNQRLDMIERPYRTASRTSSAPTTGTAPEQSQLSTDQPLLVLTESQQENLTQLIQQGIMDYFRFQQQTLTSTDIPTMASMILESILTSPMVFTSKTEDTSQKEPGPAQNGGGKQQPCSHEKIIQSSVSDGTGVCFRCGTRVLVKQVRTLYPKEQDQWVYYSSPDDEGCTLGHNYHQWQALYFNPDGALVMGNSRLMKAENAHNPSWCKCGALKWYKTIMLPKSKSDSVVVPPLCQAGKDGECNWVECPQKANYQSYCPLAKAWEIAWAKEDSVPPIKTETAQVTDNPFGKLAFSPDFYLMKIERFQGFQACCSLEGVEHSLEAYVSLLFSPPEYERGQKPTIKIFLCRDHYDYLCRLSAGGEVSNRDYCIHPYCAHRYSPDDHPAHGDSSNKAESHGWRSVNKWEILNGRLTNKETGIVDDMRPV